MNNDALFNWMERELYPALFDNMANVLPEFEFKRVGSKWISTNTLKINGEAGSNKGKVYVYANTPGLLKDWRVGAKPIVKYLMERRNKTYFEVVEALSRTVNLKPPTNPDFDPKAYEEHQKRLSLLELCNKHFIDNLNDPKKAIEVVTYLQSRGFTVEDAKAMEIGLISSQSDLILYLKKNGYSEELINETLDLKADTRIGNTHKLTIPFRSGGSLKGFKFRTTGDTHPKYINSKDLDVNGGFFNLLSINGDKDITIVEGEIDALHATLRGVENVVATGGRSINALQVRDAIRKGVKSFTLCLDNDPGKEEETRKAINRAIDTILKEGVNKIYVVTLEPGEAKIDPDTLIKEQGVEAFKELLRKHTPHYLYRLNNIFIKYSEIEKKESRELTQKEVDNLLEEVVNLSTTVREPLDRDIFNKNFLKHPLIQTLGITEKSLEKTRKDITSKEAQREAIKQLNSKTLGIQKALKENNTEEAFKLVKQAQRLEAQATELSNLYKVTTREEIIERAKNSPSGVYSGYYVNVIGEDEPYKINLPAGALTVVAGATGHGKSTLLYNMALNIVESTDKNVHFFTLEEHSDELIKKTLISYINRKLSNSFAKNCEEAITQYYKYENESLIYSNVREEFKRLEAQYYEKFIHSNRLKFDFSSYDCETLVQAIYSLKDNTNIGVIFIDYVQIINLKESKNSSRQGEVKKIMEMLKDVSVNTGLPIVLGSQFNRTVTNHLELVNTRLGEAGDIERGANLILAIWNNNDPNLKIGTEKLETEFKIEITNKGYNATNTLYIKTLKNRGGRADIQGLLTWNGNTKVIESFSNSELDRLAYAIGDDIEDAGSFGAIPTPPKEKENTLPF